MSIYDSNLILIYCCVVAAVFGVCMGSFLNCTALRIAHGEGFVKGRSHCVKCGHDLAAKDLIPILSWVFLKGKCRYCGEKISARYPLAEVVFALLTVACLLRFDLSILCLRNFVLIAVLFVLTLTDIEIMEIPDSCHVIAIVAWVVTAPFLFGGKEILFHVLAAVVFGGGILCLSLLMDRVMGRDTMGGGDIKLLFVMGLYFGFIGTLFVLIISCITGLIFNLTNKRQFPFGPWIAIAAGIMLFAGEPLINWYAGLLGV